jgi:hypothetical protein
MPMAVAALAEQQWLSMPLARPCCVQTAQSIASPYMLWKAVAAHTSYWCTPLLF